ncbi:uncharacterized protein MONOS_7767 [Monocercomonoides exilis]|uniref:uncharacterized protein n=1 Tax=Monocercomonoides exilis TaxID=2049356 RepID=UPI00355AB62A|nr:hypothetical protein MONOS_7767 [Monocercomonoides exilis]|eukprot:MONOS_7767.1-p1 / transcript=MONOS_7767.1 / gene=MONOS_7767 / organism=Monocercomonoides_exilis_PA203 / gene_product=unspecified product / transcript_product=unspecified product / location=Mono_scaffold00274:33639-34100(-) / protein_length=154 / sequence_SO=supercontig / SO=protein_coding / is_pseudo=false
MAPPFDATSPHKSFVPVVFDPFHSHQLNVFIPFSVSFCLPGCFLSSAVPINSTFPVLLHPINEVFEAVKDAKGLLRDDTIPPSYASQTDENKQLSTKVVCPQQATGGSAFPEIIDDTLEKIKPERQTLSTKGDERNGGDAIENEEKNEERTEA